MHVCPTGGVALASRLKGAGVDFTNDWETAFFNETDRANDVTDASWALERSEDLVAWESVGPSEIEMLAGDEYTRIAATTPIPSDAGGRLFLKVNVVELP